MNAKRLLALLLVLVLVFSLAACKKDTEEPAAAESTEATESSGLSGLLGDVSQAAGVEGKWVLTEAVSGTEGEDDYFVMYLGDYAQFLEVDPGVEFKADGTGSINMDGEEPEAFTWTQDGNNITISADGETMDMVYDPNADLITMSMEEDGETGTITFAREGSEAVETARNTTSEIGEFFAALANGDWGDEVTGEDYPELAMNGSVELSFTEDDFYQHARFTAPEDGEYAFWATGEEYVGMGAYNDAACFDSINYVSNFEGFVTMPAITLEADQTVYLELSISGAGDVTVYAGAPEDAPSLADNLDAVTLDEPLSVTLEGSFDTVYFSFTAPEDGDYIIFSQGDVDTMAYAYDTAEDMYNYGDNIAYNDDGENGDYGFNFCLELSLNADQTVYVKVTPWSVDEPSEITIVAAPAGEAPAAEPEPEPEPVEIPGEPETDEDAIRAYWNGDWYGYWIVDSAWGSYEGMDDGYHWWDCSVVIDYDAGTLKMWDETGSADDLIADAQISFRDGSTEYGAFMSEGGYFLDDELEHADWIVYDGMESDIVGEDMYHLIVIDGEYEDPEDSDSGFYYYVYIMPWGMSWENILAVEPDLKPYYYEDWYLPAIQAGAAMPDTILGDYVPGSGDFEAGMGEPHTNVAAHALAEYDLGYNGITMMYPEDVYEVGADFWGDPCLENEDTGFSMITYTYIYETDFNDDIAYYLDLNGSEQDFASQTLTIAGHEATRYTYYDSLEEAYAARYFISLEGAHAGNIVALRFDLLGNTLEDVAGDTILSVLNSITY